MYFASLAGRPRRREGGLPRKLLLLGTFVPLTVSLFTECPVPWPTRVLAAALWVLCLLPAFIYLRVDPRSRQPIPFLPVVSLVFGVYYILPLVLGVTDKYYNAPVYPEMDYDYPVQLVFLGWAAMMAAYVVTGLVFRPKAKPRQIAWNPRVLTRWGFFLMFGGMVIAGLRHVLLSASFFGGMFQFLLAVQWMGTGILIILARRGELSRGKRWILGIGFLLSTAILLSNGNIAPMAMLFVVAAFALWIARPHIRPRWIIGAVTAVLIAIAFRGIVIDFRRTIVEAPVQLSQRENLRLMVNLLGARVGEQGVAGALSHGFAMTAGRSAIMDLFANVVRRTPRDVPYWKGETYLSLAGSMIPRIFWPDKPTKELGQAFGHRYALIHDSNRSTAINLPILVEFFVNFGGIGVIIGMILVGVIYRVLDTLVNCPGQSSLLSMIAVVILLPLLVIESDFSLVFGGLPLTGLAFYLIWWRFRTALGPAPRQSATPHAPSTAPRIATPPAVRRLPPVRHG